MAANWNGPEYEALIERMLRQLAVRAGRTRDQEAVHWPLPDKPPVFR